jgi:hypothetical protein
MTSSSINFTSSILAEHQLQINEFFAPESSDAEISGDYDLDIDFDFTLFADIFVSSTALGEGGIPEVELVGEMVDSISGERTNSALYAILKDKLKSSYSSQQLTGGTTPSDTVYKTMYEVIKDAFGRLNTMSNQQPSEALVTAQLNSELVDALKTLGSAMITDAQWCGFCESMASIPKFVSSTGTLNCDKGTSLQCKLNLTVPGFADEITVAITLTNTGEAESVSSASAPAPAAFPTFTTVLALDTTNLQFFGEYVWDSVANRWIYGSKYISYDSEGASLTVEDSVTGYAVQLGTGVTLTDGTEQYYSIEVALTGAVFKIASAPVPAFAPSSSPAPASTGPEIYIDELGSLPMGIYTNATPSTTTAARYVNGASFIEFSSTSVAGKYNISAKDDSTSMSYNISATVVGFNTATAADYTLYVSSTGIAFVSV